MGISIWQILILLVILPLFFLPTIIAISRNHPHKTPIILINIFGGLLWGIGWLIALIWCFIKPEQKKIDSAGEIEKLHQLFEKGVLSKEEFDSQKKAILKS